MSLEENKVLARRWFEDIVNKRNVAAVKELFAANAVFNYPLLPEPLRGPEAIRQFVAGVGIAFPDIHFAVEDMFGEGNQVAVRWTVRGTFQGEFVGIQPTGKHATVRSGMSIFRLADGKFAEVWVNYNTLSLLQQLGVIPVVEHRGS